MTHILFVTNFADKNSVTFVGVYSHMRPILCLTIVGLLVQARPPAPAPSNTGKASVEGIVIRADAGAGAPGQYVAGALVELKPGNLSTTSRADGAFAFRNVPAGRYTIVVSRDGLILQEDLRRGLTRSGLTVTLTAGQAVKDITIAMTRAPVISGQVFAPHGEPIAAALVQAYRSQYTPYGPELRIVRKTMTNDLGQFRLFGLNYGEYLVSAGYSDRDRADAVGIAHVSDNVTKPDDGYATVFYGDTVNITRAEPVRLAPGSDTENLNINLIDAPRFRIRGRIIPNVPGTDILFAPAGSRLADANYSIKPTADGNFEIRKVPPGYYVLIAVADAGSSEAVPIAVSDHDIRDLTLAMAPNTDIDGRVVFGGRSLADVFALRIQLARAIVVDQRPETRVAADGLLRFTQVRAGEYDVLVESTNPETYLKNVYLNGRDAFPGKLRVAGGQQTQVTLVLASAAARVEGHVTQAGDPAGGTQVVLVPDSAFRRRPDRYVTGFTDAVGNFQLNAVPPGRYTAYAFERIEPFAYYAFAYSSDANARFSDRGVRLNVGDDGTTTVELKAIPAAESAGGLR